MNAAVLGDQAVAAQLGKRGTASDLVLYDRKGGGVLRTYVAPGGFPDRIQPLLQAVRMSEYAVFHVASLDRFTGEQAVALDVLGMRGGVLGHSYGVDEGRLEELVRGTVLEGYARAGPDGLREAADALRPLGPGGGEEGAGEGAGATRVAIDHCFDVRGVGTVALGRVESGSVRRYQEVTILPSGAEAVVKSIQMHDDPVDEASFPARVGLSLKGVRPDDVSRGDVVVGRAAAGGGAGAEGGCAVVPAGAEAAVEYEPSPFYRGPMDAGQGCLVSIGMQIRAARIASSAPGRLGIVLEKAAAWSPSYTAVVLRPESGTTRIAGSGRLVPPPPASPQA